MIFASIDHEDLKYFTRVLNLDLENDIWRFVEEEELVLGDTADRYLDILEERSQAELRNGAEYNPNLDYRRLQHILKQFYFDRLDDIRYGLDYNLELRGRELAVTEEHYPGIYRHLVAIPGDKGFGLDRENHHSGYHIHYVDVAGGRLRRSNAIFTFNPREEELRRPTLFWEPHHESASLHIDPDTFGNRRRMAIYDTCTPFLDKIPKHQFKKPSKKATRFFP